jgi:ribosomal protein L37AE/L43A
MEKRKKITKICPFCFEKVTITLLKGVGRCPKCGAPMSESDI